jgi:hypothetical protein
MRPEKWLNNRERLYVPDPKCCAHCGGSFGLIVHRSGQLKFCTLAHKIAYDRKEMDGEAYPLVRESDSRVGQQR